MTVSLAWIILLGLFSDYLFRKLRLPGLIGMLLTGMLMGPYAFNMIDPALMTLSSDFRMTALIVILLRAGLATRKDTLNRIGKTVALTGIVPGLFEGLVIMLIAPYFLNIGYLESAILGFIIAAVSPAVIVPMMVSLIESKKGDRKGIPTLLLASSSLDNVSAVVIFSGLIGIYEGKSRNILIKLAEIPFSIVSGIILGILIGFILYRVFLKYNPRATKMGMIVIGAAILLTWFENALKPFVFVSSISGVIAIGFILLEKSEPIAHKVSQKLGKIWVFAEILLFVLIGAQVNVSVALDAGIAGALIIFFGLIARSLGVYLSLMHTELDNKEKVFCIVSCIPKASVQAAVGAVPLAIGIKSGETMLAIAVLSILFTAPLGVIAMNALGEKVLQK
ncbi:MAG: sodium:proton antiporter [Nitrospiraceae bacterium]|nr:MAG: sodium:proton antiporter [Nitrospiraceae bacterium]